MPVLEILKTGFSGFVFLLSFLAYKLLAAEQQRHAPRTALLKAIAHYRSYTLVAAGLVILSTAFQFVAEELARTRKLEALVREHAPTCLKTMDRVSTIVQNSPNAAELEDAVRSHLNTCDGFMTKLRELAP